MIIGRRGDFLNLNMEIALNEKSVADGATEVVGVVAVPYPLCILTAYLVLNDDIAKADSGNVSKCYVKLVDKGENGTGDTQVGNTLDNEDAKIGKCVLKGILTSGGYVVGRGRVLALEVENVDYGTSNPPDFPGGVLYLEAVRVTGM